MPANVGCFAHRFRVVLHHEGGVIGEEEVFAGRGEGLLVTFAAVDARAHQRLLGRPKSTFDFRAICMEQLVREANLLVRRRGNGLRGIENVLVRKRNNVVGNNKVVLVSENADNGGM